VTVRVVCGETVTGRILATVPTTEDGISWETILNDAGTVDATVPLRRIPERERRNLLSYLEPNRCYLAAITDSGKVLEAGPIWKHKLDDTSGDLTVGASGLWSIFDHRKAIDPSWDTGTARVQDTQLRWSGMNLGSIAQYLTFSSLQRVGGVLPVLFQDIPDTGLAERTYPGYELGWVGERLRQLAEVSNGPDIAFEPRLTADELGIEWVMRVGTDVDPLLHQRGADWRWDRCATRGTLKLLTVDVDATGVAQRAWSIGSGMETELLLGVAQDLTPLDAGYPLLETDTSSTNTSLQTTLNAQATSALAVAKRPWSTWSIEVRDDVPPLGDYRPGDWSSISVPDEHVYLRAGEYRTRILSIAGTGKSTVSVKLAPTMELR